MKCGIHIIKNFEKKLKWVADLDDDGLLVTNFKSAFANAAAAAEEEELVWLVPSEEAGVIQKKLQKQDRVVSEQLKILWKKFEEKDLEQMLPAN